MQKTIIRIMHGVRPITLTKPLFEHANISDVFQINKYLIRKFMYNVYNSNTIDIFYAVFICNSSINSHDTRHSAHYHIPLVKRGISKTCLSYRGAVMWNDIFQM